MLRQLPWLLLVWVAALSAVPVASRGGTKPAPKAIKALLVNGKPAKDRFDRATGYLSLALNPFREPPPGGTQVNPVVISPAQFADPAATDLDAWDCVFLCDVPRFSRDEARRLETFVRAGGGVVFCLGPRVDVESYNATLFRDGKGLLPVPLLGPREAKAEHSFRFAFDEATFKGPPFAPLAAEDFRPSLRGVRTRQFVRVGEPRRGAKVRAVLSFEEVAPGKEKQGTGAGVAILEWRPFGGGKGKGGRVVLITTTVDLEWNNWPASPSFVPVAQELVRFVAADRRR